MTGHFSYLFMRKQYVNAEKNKDESVPGAQFIYKELKDCFEGQGEQNNPAPPTPPTP